MGEKLLASLLVVLLVVSAFGAAIPSIAHELTNTPQTKVPTNEMQDLQQRIYEQGFNYTVAENWITALPLEEQERLNGYKPSIPSTEIRLSNGHEPITRELVLPEPVERPTLKDLPSSYDARTLGYVTPVKNQGSCGSCWIFAATADFESDIAINEALVPDFSEQEVGDCEIFGWFCNGGDAYMATNYFTLKGAAAESCHPYLARADTCKNCPVIKNVDNWRIITDSDGNELYNVDTIKNAILNYGPVFTTIYAHWTFQTYKSGVYEYWGTQTPNHAIQIIGWDDSLGENGAWLIKNSWRTSWGINGYGWVAYGAANIGDDTSAISGYNNVDSQIYYHDEYGWTANLGCGDSTTAWGAVRFIPTRTGQLHSVDFWVNTANMHYEIKIFDTITGGPTYNLSNQLGSTQTGTATEKGYYSIPLSTPIAVDSGDDFIVQVKFTAPGYGYPIPIDYESSADFSNDSYASCDGEQFIKPNDEDSGEYYDVGIRARVTVLNQPPTATIVAITPNPAEQVFDTVSFLGNGTDPDGTVSAYNWSSSLDGPLSTAQSFTKPASELSLGTHIITFRVQDDQGAWSAESTCNLTIEPINLTRVFDTGAGSYPSIAGRHTGTITLNHSMLVHRLLTYPSPGTGGRAVSVQIGNATWNVTASGHDYSSDWQNITFNEPLILRGNQTYNYTIITDSYPQLIHAPSMSVTGGTITCTSFVDANGKAQSPRIPAIRLE
jgi:C1A family cysteine protease